MPIKKSAAKALRQSEKRASRNRARKRIVHDSVKNLEVLIHDKKKTDAVALLATVYKAIDKAAKNGVLERNAAARKKSQLTKAVNSLT